MFEFDNYNNMSVMHIFKQDLNENNIGTSSEHSCLAQPYLEIYSWKVKVHNMNETFAR